MMYNRPGGSGQGGLKSYRAISKEQYGQILADDQFEAITLIPSSLLNAVVASQLHTANYNHILRSTVKCPDTGDFVDRQHELDRLDQIFKGSSRCQRAALLGLGGIGKSRIAMQYAQSFLHTNPSGWAFWIDAGDFSSFTLSFRKVAEILHLTQHTGPRANVLRIVSDWLSATTDPWLLVLDGVDDESVFTSDPASQFYVNGNDEYSRALSSYLPQTENGMVIVTSRNRAAAGHLVFNPASVIEVKPMSFDGAMKLFKSRCPISEQDYQFAKDLVRILGCIPLAITQAAAYLHDKAGAVSISEYLDYLRDEELQVSVLQETFADMLRDDISTNSILNTWYVSFNQIYRDDPEAIEVLSLMCLLDDSGIPEALLIPDSKRIYEYRTKHIPILLRFCLIHTSDPGSSEGRSYRLHSLVQLATRAWLMHKKELDRWTRLALHRVNSMFPYGEDKSCDWSLCAQLFPHVRKVLKHSERRSSLDASLDRADLLCKSACYNRFRGGYQNAEKLCQESLEIRKRLLGIENPLTLSTGKELAHIYRDQERWSDAEAELRWVVTTRERVDLPEDKELLDSCSLLGELSVLQGRHAEGQEILEDVLDRQQKLLGLTDQYTLLTTRKLGLSYFRQNKHQEAEAYLKRAWLHQSTHPDIGRDHLNTIRTGILLAELYSCDKSTALQAINTLDQVLEASKHVLGPQHPETVAVEEKISQIRANLTAPSLVDVPRSSGVIYQAWL